MSKTETNQPQTNQAQTQTESIKKTTVSKRKVKALQNINIRTCCFDKLEAFELNQAETLRSGQKRFIEGHIYELLPERAEDWVEVGYCEYVR